MLALLVNQYVLSQELANETAELYADLNEAVHGSERNLIHSGVYEGKWSGHIFNNRKFGEWCDYLSRSIDLGIRLTQINMVQWNLAKPTTPVFCMICHSHSDLMFVEEFEHGGYKINHLRCQNCGREFNFREDGGVNNSYAQIIEGQTIYIHQPKQSMP